jgi:hypothetical protein
MSLKAFKGKAGGVDALISGSRAPLTLSNAFRLGEHAASGDGGRVKVWCLSVQGPGKGIYA